MFKALLNPVTKRHVEQKILRTSPRRLYDVIIDVDQYSSFLPLCSHSQILRRSNCGGNFEATLTVGLPPLFAETYVSCVRANEEALMVETSSIESKLFDSLKSRWKLHPIEGDNMKCHVDFEVSITASDPLIVATLDQVLREVAGRQVEAFEQRCYRVSVDHGSDCRTSPKQ